MVVQAVAAPVPPAVAPAQVTDVQAAERVAVDGAPEEDVAGVALFIFLPFLGNEVGVREQVVEDVGVEGRLLHHFRAELVVLDDLVVLLAFGEPKLDHGGVPFDQDPCCGDLPFGVPPPSSHR